MQQGFDIVLFSLIIFFIVIVVVIFRFILPLMEERKYIKMEIARSSGNEKNTGKKSSKSFTLAGL